MKHFSTPSLQFQILMRLKVHMTHIIFDCHLCNTIRYVQENKNSQIDEYLISENINARYMNILRSAANSSAYNTIVHNIATELVDLILAHYWAHKSKQREVVHIRFQCSAPTVNCHSALCMCIQVDGGSENDNSAT